MKEFVITLLVVFGCWYSAIAQDVLVKRDGSEMKVKVVEIGEKEVRYKKLSNLEGPMYFVSVDNLVYLRLANGDEEIFSQEAYDKLKGEKLDKQELQSTETAQATPSVALQSHPQSSTPMTVGGPHIVNRYHPGDYYNEGGIRGIVIDADDEGHGIVMSLDEANLRWCDQKKGDLQQLGINNQYDGWVNQEAFAQLVVEGKVRWEDYPAFAWCHEKGEGWYLPAINEILRVGHVYNNGRVRFDRKAREQFNDLLKSQGGKKLDKLMYYFSSTEDAATTALTTHMDIEPPFVAQTSKNTSFLIRAMHKF
jgi:hypothetical protein